MRRRLHKCPCGADPVVQLLDGELGCCMACRGPVLRRGADLVLLEEANLTRSQQRELSMMRELLKLADRQAARGR